MRPRTQADVLLVVAVVVLATVVSGRFLFLVRPAMRWPLVATAIVLLVAAASLVLRAHRRGAAPAHGHGPSRIGVLLAVPFVLMAVVPPAPLGSWSAQRTDGFERGAAPSYPALPAADPVTLTVGQVVERAAYDPTRSLTGRRLRVLGFVTPRPQGGWALSRMVMVCCAADAYPASIDVEPVPGTRLATPAKDTWVEVEGTWVPTPATTDGRTPVPPRLQVAALRVVPPPRDPYE